MGATPTHTHSNRYHNDPCKDTSTTSILCLQSNPNNDQYLPQWLNAVLFFLDWVLVPRHFQCSQQRSLSKKIPNLSAPLDKQHGNEWASGISSGILIGELEKEEGLISQATAWVSFIRAFQRNLVEISVINQ